MDCELAYSGIQWYCCSITDSGTSYAAWEALRTQHLTESSVERRERESDVREALGHIVAAQDSVVKELRDPDHLLRRSVLEQAPSSKDQLRVSSCSTLAEHIEETGPVVLVCSPSGSSGVLHSVLISTMEDS